MDPADNTVTVELRHSKVFQQISSIKRGEFKRLFRNGATTPLKRYKMRIPEKEIARLEEAKQPKVLLKEGTFSSVGFHVANNYHSSKPDGGIRTRLSGIDLILKKRKDLEQKKNKDLDNAMNITTASGNAELTVTEKIKEQAMRDWVGQCYDTINDIEKFTPKTIQQLAERRREKRRFIENMLNADTTIRTPSMERIDEDLSSDVSSEGSEGLLRKKVTEERVKGKKSAFIKREKEHQTEAGHGVIEKRLEGINIALEDFYIPDLQELKSLAYDEELYAFNSSGNVVGSWRVNVTVCEENESQVYVQFEGLLISEDDTNHCMYASGVVDRTYCPITEFRVEVSSGKSGHHSQTMFFHKRKQNWYFDLRNDDKRGETCRTFKLDYEDMIRVVTEPAHILLMRKIVTYRYPLNFEELKHAAGCCFVTDKCTCHSGFPTRKKFVLKMRTLTIGGQICRANYRFYAPVKVKFHRQDLEVVRVRRRVEMPGELVQTCNYYMTTAGQLVAITFNDPYPHDTPYYLQVDPKAVLDPHRVIPPERIVPLRERYMYDPELKRFYEEEVERFLLLQGIYMESKNLNYVFKKIFSDLLADKPHRLAEYMRGFFIGAMVGTPQKKRGADSK